MAHISFSLAEVPRDSSGDDEKPSSSSASLSHLREQEEETLASIRRLEEEVESLQQQKESLRAGLANLDEQCAQTAAPASLCLALPEGAAPVAVRTPEAEAMREEISGSVSYIEQAEEELLAAITLMKQTLLELKRERLSQEAKAAQPERARGEGQEAARQEADGGREERREDEGQGASAVLVVSSDESSGMSFSEGEEGESGDTEATGKRRREPKDGACRCIFPVVQPDGSIEWRLGTVHALLQSPSPLHSFASARPSSSEASAASATIASASSQELGASDLDPDRVLPLCAKWCHERRDRLSPVSPNPSVSSSAPAAPSSPASSPPRFWALVTTLTPLAPRDIPCLHLLQFLRPHSAALACVFPAPRASGTADEGARGGEACPAGGPTAKRPENERPEVAAAREVASDAGLQILGNAQILAEQLHCTDSRGAGGKAENADTAARNPNEAGRATIRGEREARAEDVSRAPGGAFVPSAAYVESAGCPYSWRCRFSHGTWVPACDVCLVHWNSAGALREMLQVAHSSHETPSEGNCEDAEHLGRGTSANATALFYRGRPVFVLPDGSQTWHKARLVQALRKRRKRAEPEGQGDPAAARGQWTMYGRVELDATRDGASRRQRLLCRAACIHPRIASPAEESASAHRTCIEKSASEEESCDDVQTSEAARRRGREGDRRVGANVVVLDSDAISVDSSSSSDDSEEQETRSTPSDEEEGSERWQKLRRLESLLGVKALDLRARFSSAFSSRNRDALSPSPASSGSSASSQSCPLSGSSHFGCWMLYTSGVGLRLMQRWGYRPGECLGRSQRLLQARQNSDGGSEKKGPNLGKGGLKPSGGVDEVAGRSGPTCATDRPPLHTRDTGRQKSERGNSARPGSSETESSGEDDNDEADGIEGGTIVWPGEHEKLSPPPSLPPLVNPLGIRVLPPRLSLDFISDPLAARRRGRNRRRGGADGPSAAGANCSASAGSWQYAEGALVPSFCGASATRALAREEAVANDGAFGLINSIYSSGFATVERSDPASGDARGRRADIAETKTRGARTGGETGHELEEAFGERTLGPLEMEENRRKQEEEEHLQKLQQLRRSKNVGEKALRKQLFDLQQRQRALKKEIGVATVNQRRHADGGKARGGVEAFAGYYGGIAAAKENQLRRMKEEEEVILKLISDKGKEKKLKVF
ncbi:conserved hypothetical protein [Neospora caninum Liverpool]|uniref:G-patch domain-containing protein n=1 Tax=Neospora caninum (strain Liverpool) TaxID=572307 RepID=F0VH20_NEOCL|nr:conserved hypothetical protein [Neospora caninum Liverpool]CBZ53014.1 conserved hypothetical protein [Neospora caninum Liverpool]CEL66998.1 TPA: hypothetical protein BN1204_028030 [Neospora caninum Liverpool]|eukprot:XP_003883046.1 conserved hypothetical protein [Neospora caninum Liverpool]